MAAAATDIPDLQRVSSSWERAKQIKEVFRRADIDDDGILTATELFLILKALNAPFTDEQLEELFDQADQNGDGYLCYNEFADWLANDSAEKGQEASQLVSDVSMCELRESHMSVQAQHFFKELEPLPPWTVNARIVICRHAVPAHWSKGTPGVRDPELSEKGHAQAKLLAKRLARSERRRGFDLLVTSPMQRVLQTVEPVASVDIDIRRRVCHAQFCEHRSDPLDFSEDRVRSTAPGVLGPETGAAMLGFGEVVPGAQLGQDLAEHLGVATRCRAEHLARWLQADSALWREGAVVGVFAHQTMLDLFIQILVKGHSNDWLFGMPEFKMDKASVTELTVGPAGVHVVIDNDNGHLLMGSLA